MVGSNNFLIGIYDSEIAVDSSGLMEDWYMGLYNQNIKKPLSGVFNYRPSSNRVSKRDDALRGVPKVGTIVEIGLYQSVNQY